MAENERLVFVYGTLRKHLRNASYLVSSACVAQQGRVSGRLLDTGKGFPAMVRERRHTVFGELYRVPLETLHELDILEGYEGEKGRNHYERIRCKVYTDFGTYSAYTYVYRSPEKDPDASWIESGDWKCHLYMKRLPKYYFAYGSCMDDKRFREDRVAHKFSRMLGKGVLNGYSLRFTLERPDGARADIVEDGGTVEGKVYRIDREALGYLYYREGVHQKTYRPVFVDIHIEGKVIRDCLTFVVIDKQREKAPPVWYAEEILRGAKGTVSQAYFKRLQSELRSRFQLDLSV